jgi:hydroxyethylthiazole kinase
MTAAERVWQDVEAIRNRAPLIHNITNYVVMNTTANALLAIGASPVMAHAIEEVEEMTGLAAALVVNIGTLSGSWIESMRKAASQALRIGIPIVLDPVGAGATRFRTETARRFLEETPPTILRGNASEVLALAHDESGTKGVDSRRTPGEAREAAARLAGRYGCVVSVSGAADLISDGTLTARVFNGHPLMPRVTGLGCVASALSGAFAAVNPDPYRAAVHAMAVMGIAGEIAADGAEGPAAFQVRFVDALFNLDAGEIAGRLRMESD